MHRNSERPIQKSIGLILFFLTWLCLPAGAAPYFDVPHEFIQPDGSRVTLILNGDEFYMEAHTPDGYSAVRDPQTGWICYAELSEDGADLISTGVPIEPETATSVSTATVEKAISPGKTAAKKLKIETSAKLRKIKQKQKQLFGEDFKVIRGQIYPAGTADAAQAAVYSQPSEEGDLLIEADAGTLPPTKNISTFTGTIRGLVLVFDFSDAPATYTLAQYQDKVNKVNSHYSDGIASSLRTYYEDVSRGVFLMNHFVYGIYRAPQTFAYYDSLNYTEGARQLMSYALNDMEANGFDFSQLTTFSSGEIRALAVMYTGNPQAWAEGMWYHAGGWSGFSADGVHTGRYCTDTANDLNPGTLIHEHGHMAAEWPDTYSYIGGEPGTWGVMGGGYCSLPNPYFLYENGWLDGENIMGYPGLKTMNSTDPHFAYFYYDPDQPTEFFVMRPYVTSLLYCPSIPDQGMTFWRINTQGDNANYPNTDRHVELVHANNTDTNKTSNVCFKEGGLLDHFSSFTTPSSDWKFGAKSGLPSGLEAADISAAGAQMTFVLGAPPEPIPYYPLNGSFNDASGSGNSAVGYNFPGTPWSADTFEGSYFDLNQSLHFDGVDDYVVCPAAVGASAALTVAFWVKPETAVDMIPLDKFPADSSGAGWSVQLTEDGWVLLRIGSQFNNTEVTTNGPVWEANRWTHIACTYADGTARIFINGALRMVKHGIAQSVNTTALNVRMGIASQVDTQRIFQGFLDDVRFYDLAMESGPLNAIDGLNFRPEKGLLAYLKLDEASGTRAEDASGHEYHGTLNNGLSFDGDSVAGPVGGALSFDGADDYISLPGGMSQRNGGFTVTVRAYPTAIKNWARFIDFGNGPYAGNILLSRYQSTNNLVFETYSNTGSGGYVIAPSAIELNKWQFYAATVNTSGAVKIYKNGQVVQTGTSAAPPEIYRRNLYIGRSNWSADSYYQGSMDDIRIYNYTLTDAEILAIYQSNQMDGPIPFNGDPDVSPETTLQFTPAAHALYHDIYFGTEYNAVLSADPLSPEYRGRKQCTEYNPLGLEGWREYFWRVDEVMPDGSIRTGPVWRFSTIGNIQRQVWTGLSGVNELTGLTGSANYPDNPSLVTTLDLFQIPTDWDDSYGTRVHGLLVPQTSGSYRFWISGDNEVELWLSTDADPAHASRIAYIHGTWSSPLNFDQFASQQSALFTLQAGQSYYIMALHKEGYGGDHMAVAWQGPDSPVRAIIDSFWLRPPHENEWPYFDPSTAPTLDASEGLAFSAAMPIPAADPDWDPVIYSKYTGPSWLHVSADGQLTGIPANADAGGNTFIIRAFDGQGGSDDILLPIQVASCLTGSTGLDDLFGFAEQWLTADCPDTPACGGADLDGDADVTLADFSILSNHWLADAVMQLYLKFDEMSGTVAEDDSIYSRAGSLVNTPTRSAGISEGALSFDGADDSVMISGYTGIGGGQPRTVCAWIKTNQLSGGIVNYGNAGTGTRWLFILDGTGKLQLGINGGNIISTQKVADGQWHHVTAVLDDFNDDGVLKVEDLRLYIDGQPAAGTYTNPSTVINTSLQYPVRIGVIEGPVVGALSAYFGGRIDEVRLYDKALTQQEIQDIAGL